MNKYHSDIADTEVYKLVDRFEIANHRLCLLDMLGKLPLYNRCFMDNSINHFSIFAQMDIFDILQTFCNSQECKRKNYLAGSNLWNILKYIA
jgi:hypothetical protein